MGNLANSIPHNDQSVTNDASSNMSVEKDVESTTYADEIDPHN